MGIIKKFKSFFKDNKDTNVDKYYWFDNEIEFLTKNGFEFADEGGKVGTFTKDNIKIEKKAYIHNVEDYYFIISTDDDEVRFETFSKVKNYFL